jgi:hypothetical protein
MKIELPEYAHVLRTLGCGMHPYRTLLPGLEESPAARRIESHSIPLGPLMDEARVNIVLHEGYCYVDVKIPAIILAEDYYHRANPLDLYLDMTHELTHLRPTEIEGYAIAVEEGLRLGMTEDEIMHHLSNPWLSNAEVTRLRKNIARFLEGKE